MNQSALTKSPAKAGESGFLANIGQIVYINHLQLNYIYYHILRILSTNYYIMIFSKI